MPSITLQDAVHDLIRPHIRREGPLKGQWEDALLDQLEEAVHPSSASGGSGKSEGHAPVNITAMDAQRDIAVMIRDEAYEAGEESQRPITSILSDWAEGPGDQGRTHVLLDVIDRIREAVEPQVKPIPLDQACPDVSCGVRRVRQKDEAGSWVRRPALSVYCRDERGLGVGVNDWTARCAACGREWHGASELSWLGRMLNGTVQEVA